MTNPEVMRKEDAARKILYIIVGSRGGIIRATGSCALFKGVFVAIMHANCTLDVECMVFVRLEKKRAMIEGKCLYY